MSKKPLKKQQKTTPSWLMWAALGALALIVVAAASLFAVNQLSASNRAFPAQISVDEAYKFYNEGAFLLDVRTQEEWDEYHVPGTTLIPLDELPDRLAEVPADQTIVVVCRSGNRSQKGRDILLDAGFDQVTSMADGLKVWRTQGYPVTTGP
jgi:rhodanese-related sulfurtransferase